MPRVSGCWPGLMSKCTNEMIWNIMHYYAESEVFFFFLSLYALPPKRALGYEAGRIRAGTTTMSDYLALINPAGTKTLTSANWYQVYKVIVQIRQHINVTSVFEFARSRNQPLFTSMAAYHCTNASITVDDWWSLAVRLDPVSSFSQSTCQLWLTKILISFGIVNGKDTTAVYVALSRRHSSLGLPFLRAFPHVIFFAKPDNTLQAEQTRLKALEIETSIVNYEALLAAY